MHRPAQRSSRIAVSMGFALLAGAVLWLIRRNPTGPGDEGGDMNRTEGNSRNHTGILWFVFLAGPIFWIIDLMLGYVIAAIGCDAHYGGATLLGHILTFACAIGTAFAGYVALRQWRRSGVDEMTVANGGGNSRTFMELAGILMSAYFLLLIIGEDIALFVLKPCQAIT